MHPPPRHPYFDDRASVSWHRTLAEGAAAARASGQRLFIAVTHPDCGGSRALLERVLPKEEISEELRAGFACVCADARDPEPEVAALLAKAAKREPTPVCLYAVAEEGGPRLVLSTAGGRPAAVFLCDLTEARTRR
jgi:hypothetical protein